MPNDPITTMQLRVDAARLWLEKHRSLGVPEAQTLAEAFTEVNQQNFAMRLVLGSFLPLLEQNELIHASQVRALLAPVGKLLVLGLAAPAEGKEN